MSIFLGWTRAQRELESILFLGLKSLRSRNFQRSCILSFEENHSLREEDEVERQRGRNKEWKEAPVCKGPQFQSLQRLSSISTLPISYCSFLSWISRANEVPYLLQLISIVFLASATERNLKVLQETVLGLNTLISVFNSLSLGL